MSKSEDTKYYASSLALKNYDPILLTKDVIHDPIDIVID